MKKNYEKAGLFAILILLSAGVYFVHYSIFHDTHHIVSYLITDMAFLPLEILFVTLIFHKLLEEREKKSSFRKLNMIIGVFFSEIGNKLLHFFIESGADLGELNQKLLLTKSWNKKDFQSVMAAVQKYQFDIDMEEKDSLRQFLFDKREFMLKIIENPVLLEHELFSELMMAIFHLEEELSSRKDVNKLQPGDKAHIDIDTARVYQLLIQQWVLYMQHLQKEYPYLFSFAVRTNPFNKNAKIEVTKDM